MSRCTGRGAQQFVQSRLGFVSIAAILCLSAAPKLSAEQAAQEGQPAATQNQPGTVSLPTVRVDPPRRAPAKRAASKKGTTRPPPPPVAPVVPAEPPTATNYLIGTSGSSRITTPLINTPQSITVVPQKIMREQNTSTVLEALRNVPGITFRGGEGGQQGDAPFIRGFDARNDMFRDGVRDPGWYTRDSFSVDRVEVLKGPSSFLFGRGSTGGVINLITKTPIFGSVPPTTNAPMFTKAPLVTKAPFQSPDFVDVSVSGNTGPGARATLDANRQINENVAGRIQVMGQRYDIPDRDHVEENRWGVAPSMAFRFTESTRATLSYIYQHDDSIPDRGIPYLPASWGLPRFPAPAPRNAWYGVLSDPSPDQEKIDAHIATAQVVHEFTNDIKITNTSRYVNVDRFNRATLPNNFNPAPGTNLATFLYRPGRQHSEVANELLANNTDFSANFATGMLLHSLVAGVDVAREERKQTTRGYVANTAGTTNFFDPDPYRTPGTFNPPGTPTTSEANSFGAYLADQIKITRYFELLGGVRYDIFNARAGSTTILEREDRMWSWRVGAVFHPIENTSLYVMHGTSFNPSAEFLTLSAANARIGPEQNETTEVGVKADVLDKRLSLTAAVFRTDKTNARVPDPANLTVNILEGVTRVEGFELGAIGRITESWQIFAGYTYLRSEIVETTNAALLGKELFNTPKNSFSLWTTYDVTPQWTIGGGAFFVDAMWGNAANETRVPSYWRFDAMTSYKVTANITAQLNVYNITDEYYYAQVYNNWAVPGPGRSAALTLRARW